MRLRLVRRSRSNRQDHRKRHHASKCASTTAWVLGAQRGSEPAHPHPSTRAQQCRPHTSAPPVDSSGGRCHRREGLGEAPSSAGVAPRSASHRAAVASAERGAREPEPQAPGAVGGPPLPTWRCVVGRQVDRKAGRSAAEGRRGERPRRPEARPLPATLPPTKGPPPPRPPPTATLTLASPLPPPPTTTTPPTPACLFAAGCANGPCAACCGRTCARRPWLLPAAVGPRPRRPSRAAHGAPRPPPPSQSPRGPPSSRSRCAAAGPSSRM